MTGDEINASLAQWTSPPSHLCWSVSSVIWRAQMWPLSLCPFIAPNHAVLLLLPAAACLSFLLYHLASGIKNSLCHHLWSFPCLWCCWRKRCLVWRSMAELCDSSSRRAVLGLWCGCGWRFKPVLPVVPCRCCPGMFSVQLIRWYQETCCFCSTCSIN